MVIKTRKYIMQNWINLSMENKLWPFILLIFISKLSIESLSPIQSDAVLMEKRPITWLRRNWPKLVVLDLTELWIIEIYHPQKAFDNGQVFMQENFLLTLIHFFSPGVTWKWRKKSRYSIVMSLPANFSQYWEN